jgi:hypothetical protein
MSLTDTEVRKAKTKDVAYRLSDARSLYVWVTPAGGKLWRWSTQKLTIDAPDASYEGGLSTDGKTLPDGYPGIPRLLRTACC